MKSIQKLFRTYYIDAKMSYESIARIERVSKLTQTEIFRFKKSVLKKKFYSKDRKGMCIQLRGATHVLCAAMNPWAANPRTMPVDYLSAMAYAVANYN